MQTVDKAITLLGFFSVTEPEIGLSELARLAGYDKAATRRFLVALAKHHFIEQNPEDRKYRLGPAFLRFARVREVNMPLASVVQPIVRRLADETGETAHASLFSGDRMSTIAIAEPQRATRVFVDPSQPLTLHATASGQSCLAFSDDKNAKVILSSISLEKHTASTPVTKKALTELLSSVRKRGYARAIRSFEDDTTGTAVPIFDGAARPVGALAVAAVASRFTKEVDALVVHKLLIAASEATSALGGRLHSSVESALKALKNE
jgi:IclR family transcriptional regulator, acetate operon repressor